MNGHHVRYWCQENSSEIHESSVHSVKEAGWCGVTSSDVIQTHILGEEQLDTATVNAKRCQDTLENFMALDRCRPCARNVWFNKITTFHTSGVSVDILWNIFPGRFNSRFGGNFWPPRTPDLRDPNTLKAHAFQQVFRN